MTQDEFKQALKEVRTFKSNEEEIKFLNPILQYWITHYSPPIHSVMVTNNGKIIENGWLKDMELKRGGKNELLLLRRCYQKIKSITTFAD